MLTYRYRATTQGRNMACVRNLRRAIGMTNADVGKPIIPVVT
jgi:dihydroxyacid dehydratase/phosphogluconate dehydratase